MTTLYLRAAVVLLLLLSTILFTCQKTEKPPVGVLTANAAYLMHFGQPPTVRSGVAYARVGYLPLKERGQLRPVPLFLYKEEGQIALLLRHMVAGGLKPFTGSNYENPFPAGSSVRVAEQGRVVRIELSLKEPKEADLETMIAVLVETVSQFEAIGRVLVEVNGQPAPGMPADGFTSDPSRVVPVGPPVLLQLAAVSDEEGAPPEELLVNFDRPVTIDSFRLSHVDGRKVEGDSFTSVFQMAIVIHPVNPELFRAGETLRVEWQVSDALGRVGSGHRLVAVEAMIHEVELENFKKKRTD